MKGTPEEARQLGKAPLHERKPLPKPIMLSEKLAWLSIQKHQAGAWWAAEVKKLVAPAEYLEKRQYTLGIQGLLAGVVMGLALAFYLNLFGG